MIASVLTIAACSTQPPAPEQSVGTVQNAGPATIIGDTVTKPVTTGGMASGIDNQLQDPKSAIFKRTVFFDYDQYLIKDEFKPLIDAHAKFLTKRQKMKMLIQGSTDDRGSREYNLALGQRRADAIKKALALLGVSEEQMESVSLGAEKPRCDDHTESCWSENRRGDMLYSGEF
jgi:peptidoglycan-associated lipoprotein